MRLSLALLALASAISCHGATEVSQDEPVHVDPSRNARRGGALNAKHVVTSRKRASRAHSGAHESGAGSMMDPSSTRTRDSLHSPLSSSSSSSSSTLLSSSTEESSKAVSADGLAGLSSPQSASTSSTTSLTPSSPSRASSLSSSSSSSSSSLPSSSSPSSLSADVERTSSAPGGLTRADVLAAAFESVEGYARERNGTVPGTPESLDRFMTSLLPRLKDRTVAASVAEWAKATNLTDSNIAASNAATADLMRFVGSALLNFTQQWGNLPKEMMSKRTEREVYLLQTRTAVPPPGSVEKQLELASIISGMEGNFSTTEVCEREDGSTRCKSLSKLEDEMNEFVDYKDLLRTWVSWRDAVGPKLRPSFLRYRELANEGAETLGYRNLADMWQSGYDLEASKFVDEVDGMYTKVKPLYEALHCYVRRKLHERYGARAPDGFDAFIPAHLLGGMWGQDWTRLWTNLDLQPYANEPSLDISSGLQAQFGSDPKKMVRSAEDFFVGLGFSRLPSTFWERSVFSKPVDGTKMVCHASAWDVTYDDDVRIKACFHTNQRDYFTAHHELGHCYYFHSYHTRNVLFQDGANDGFHEAIGDTIMLSLTPAYLKKIKLLPEASESDGAVINDQLLRALDKVAFLPYAYLVDKWRYDVFSGRVKEGKMNEHWWSLRQKYQGVMAPVKRSDDEGHFDPGAKYHVAANVPYMRYFLASMLQFQFHRALCRAANHTGPLHTCSIAGSKVAGERLRKMLSLGATVRWQDALEVISPGEKDMDPTALLDYFSPLREWLEDQNGKHTCNWPESAPVQPVDPRSHLGLMIGLAAGAAVAIFIGAGAFNWWQMHKGGEDAAYDKLPGRGDYDGM